jgi:hypothetical protein
LAQPTQARLRLRNGEGGRTTLVRGSRRRAPDGGAVAANANPDPVLGNTDGAAAQLGGGGGGDRAGRGRVEPSVGERNTSLWWGAGAWAPEEG